jgi:Family of unknown function (DUF6188)
MRVDQHGGAFEVTFNHAEVTLVQLDSRLRLVITDSPHEPFDMAMAAKLRVRRGAEDPGNTIDPSEASSGLGELAVTLRWQAARRCLLTAEGVLTLELESGLTIDVQPDPDYEAWQVLCPGYLIIATPGGELAVWDKASGSMPMGSADLGPWVRKWLKGTYWVTPMSPGRLRFFGDYGADGPLWSDAGHVNLNALPISNEARTRARAWARRWDELNTAQIQAQAFIDGMSGTYVEPVPDAQWVSLERHGRAIFRRLQEELGEGWVVEWA